MKKVRRMLAVPVAAAALAALFLAATAGPASADYGQGAAYQIEITSNIPGAQGGGIWLWIELMPASPGATYGTSGDYTGSDCGRGAAERARADHGDITAWSVSGGVLTIHGVVLNGFGGLPVTITVPLPASGYGHVTTDVISIFPDLANVLGLPPGV